MPHIPSRRVFLAALAGTALAGSRPAAAACAADPLTVCNVSQLYAVATAGIVPVHDTDDLRAALRRWPGRFSIGGGRYSMGGQTALEGGLQLDMRAMAGLVWLDPVAHTVRVQAGMRWRSLQALIDPLGLAVRTMQSYANFTVGGSVSVNCHGRYVGHGPIVGSVRALQLVLPDGMVVESSPTRESTLFFAAIGGYGGVGVVTEVELALDDNMLLSRRSEAVPLADYADWFRARVLADPAAVLHNADLSPPSFDQPLAVTWSRSLLAPTEPARLRPVDGSYGAERAAIWALSALPGADALRRSLVPPRLAQPAVVWRNHEASRDVAELEPASRSFSTYVLQEYFVPESQFVPFSRALAALLARTPEFQTLNVSIRHAGADHQSLMAWAREDVFCFVLYTKQRTSAEAQQAVATWTRTLVALALAHGGRYYLPYEPHATLAQFESAYPQVHALRALRRELGATRCSNALWERYGV